MERGLVGDGELVASGGQAAPLFESRSLSAPRVCSCRSGMTQLLPREPGPVAGRGAVEVAEAVDAGGAGNAAEGESRAGEAPRSRRERVRAAPADVEEVHRRRVIGLEQCSEALAEEDVPADVASEMSQKKVVGPRRAVPHHRHASGVTGLSPDHQALTAAAAGAGDNGLGARRAAVVPGWDSTSAARVEGARARLKRLVERGRLVEATSGGFTLSVPPSQQDTGAGRPGGGS